MRELRLKRQSLTYKLHHLEDQLKSQSDRTVHAFTGYVRDLAFETGMKIAVGLLLRYRKKAKSKKEKEKEKEE